jgi:ankyrin repeat protein
MDAGTGGAVAAAAPELVNAPDAEGHTPLHLAVIAGDTQLVAVLLANGADVNAKDLEGHSVLHWATGTTFNIFKIAIFYELRISFASIER